MSQSPQVPQPQFNGTDLGAPSRSLSPTVFGSPSNIASQGSMLMASALQAASSISAIAAGLQVPVINPVFPTIPAAPLPVNVPDPTIKEIAWSMPVQPVASYGDLGNIDGLLPAPFTDAAPTLSFGTAPAKDFGDAPEAPSIDLNLVLPTANFKLPTAPDLIQVESIKFDGVTLPTWDVEAPTLKIAAPTPVLYNESARYTSTLLTMVTGDLQNALKNGTAISLPTSVLSAQFDAASEREFYAQRDALDALDRMESSGFALPGGVWLDARLKIETETSNKRTGLSRDIMIKSAELTLDNLVKAREQAVTLESRQIEYTNQIAQRAFEAAKYYTEALVSIYNGQVNAFNAMMEGYKARAQVYAEQIRGALAIAEIYKTRVEAENVKAQINTSLVQKYKAEVDAALGNVEIYKAELQGVQIAAELQKTKIEVFGEQIKAYTGRINAFSAQVEAYKTGVQAQSTVMEAYTARVGAYKATVEAGVAQIDGKVKGYQAKISGYEAQLKGFSASLEAQVQQVKATSEYNQSAVEVFRARVQSIASYNELLTKQWSAAVEIAEKEAEVAIKAAEANVQAYLQAKQIAVEAAKTSAQVAAQLGAAAFNAIHFSTSASFSNSASQSYAESLSYAASQSASSSDNYSESVSA